MTSVKVTCCSCFFDQCICLSTQDDRDTFFDKIMLDNVDIFIKEKRNHCVLNGPLLYTEYVISCFHCFTFQLWNLTIENIDLFNTVQCSFTYADPFNFGEDFSDDIFVGNEHLKNNNLSRAELEQIFLKSYISSYFFTQPSHKSCFASMQLCRYSFFCSKCKQLYCDSFLKDLHVFWFQLGKK